MKFNQVVHPEVVMDKRGDLENRKFYKNVLSRIKISEGGYYADRSLKFLFEDNGSFNGFSLIKKFLQDTGKIYHFGKDFILALSKVDIDIPTHYLPERFIGYINFPKQTLKHGVSWIQGAYIYIGPPDKSTFDLQDSQNTTNKVFWCAFITEFDPSTQTDSFCSNLFTIENKKMEDLLKRCKHNTNNKKIDISPDRMQSLTKIYTTVINAVLYIHSQKPEMIRVPASHELSHRKWGEFKAKHQDLSNGCTLPITFINWLYKRQRVFSKDGTIVNTYLRWQRCGKALSELKLIWVREHERHYKHVYNQEGNEASGEGHP